MSLGPNHRELVAAFFAAMILLASVGVLSYYSVVQQDADQKWVEHTHEVLEKLEAVRTQLFDLQTRQSAYSATKDKSFLDSPPSGASQVRQNLQDLRVLTADNAKQQASLDRLEPLVVTELTLLQSQRGGGEAIAQNKLETSSIRPTNQIQTLISEMKQEEQGLLAERQRQAETTSRRTKVIIVFGSLLALILFSIAGFTVLGEMRKRTRSEQALETAEERYQLVFNANPLPAWVYDTQTLAFLDVNPAAIAHYGYSREEFLGLTIKDIRPAEEVPAVVEAVASLGVTTEESGIWRNRKHRKKDGTLFDIEGISHPLFYAGRSARFAIALDVTERKKTEQETLRRSAELDAANKELEAFSYSVSHDLRAPLRGIDGFSQALFEDYASQLDDTGKDYLQRVRAAAQRMALLIDDLLNLSRVTRAEMHREWVDLSQIALAIATELRAREPERKADFVVAPSLRAEGDPRLMRVVLENLLGNSWKFTSKCEHARIEFAKSQSNGRSAFFVRDNGAGFNQAHANRLFGAFQRLHGMNEFPGTGIGLATVQRIIHRHGGKVWAEGVVNQGATFYFRL